MSICQYKKPPISTLPKYLRPDLYHLKIRKKLKTFLIVRIELSLNENMLKGLKYK